MFELIGKIRGHRLCIKLTAIVMVSPGKSVKTWDRCFGSITSLWYQSAKKKRKSSIEVSKVFFLRFNSGVFAKKKTVKKLKKKTKCFAIFAGCKCNRHRTAQNQFANGLTLSMCNCNLCFFPNTVNRWNYAVNANVCGMKKKN